MHWQTTQPSLLLRLRDSADHASWTEFDRRYGELVLRYCLSKGLQLSDAEDVRQEVLVSLARIFPKFEYQPAKGRFRSYLGRVVHNAVLRSRTRPHRRREMLLEDEELLSLDVAPPPDDRWEREWTLHHVRVALRAVRRTSDSKSVEAFEHFLAGDSGDVVARKTGLSKDAAYKVRQRVRDRLRAQIERQLAEEEESFEG